MSTSKRKRPYCDKGNYLPLNVKKSIELLFERKFSYNASEFENFLKNDQGKFKGSLKNKWQIEKYLGFKNELNDLKNNLNDKNMLSWHKHTRQVNLAGNIAQEIRYRFWPELCTQAWCKFYEIASSFLNIDVDTPYFSVHLCEAPGAFVTSLNQFLKSKGFRSQWRWIASTLNPYYEGNNIGQMIDDDRFIRCSLDNWYFGQDQTGNLMSIDNLNGLCDLLKDSNIDLVTADGSIDCQWNPAEQENVVSQLQYCETIAALHILSPGGTFVVKMFTLLECQSVCLMYLLNCVFKQVHVFKPCTSKGGNSEVYVICEGYIGKEAIKSILETVTPLYFASQNPDGCLFALSDIPEAFLKQHDRCTEFFKDCQMTSIQRNLDLYADPDLQNDMHNERSKLNVEKEYCMDCFFSRYVIRPLDNDSKLMKKRTGRRDKTGANCQFEEREALAGKFTGCFTERLQLMTIPWQQRLLMFDTYTEEVDYEDNSLWIQCLAGCIRDVEVEQFHMLCGQAVERISSSQFCHGFYLHRMLEIIDNVQWIIDPPSSDSDFIQKVVDGLIISLNTAAEKIYTPKNVPDIDMSDILEQGHGTRNDSRDIASDLVQEGSINVSVKLGIKAKNNGAVENILYSESNASRNKSAETGSAGGTGCAGGTGFTGGTEGAGVQERNKFPKFSCVLKTQSSEILQNLVDRCKSDPSAILCVSLYCASRPGITARFELTTQIDLCASILDILKSSQPGATVVIEMGTSLTRSTAGLLYCLYRSFKEIGFIHNHGNLLRRHLVCVSFKHCPISLLHYLEVCLQKMQKDKSEAVLEIIPVLMLLQDSDFTSFLHISNSSLLKSTITTIVLRECQIIGQAS